MLDTLLWTEKYRPASLDEVALTAETRAVLSKCLEEKEIPHLLLHGPAGTGKTTVSKIITGQLDCDVLTLNASDERGIDTVRDKVGTFVRGQLFSRWRIVFLDEADQLTRDAQAALRNMMETYSQDARFILTCNYLYKVIDPIQSRCTSIELSEMPLKERFRVVKRVAENEGIKYSTPQVLLSYVERFQDMRRLLTTLQKAHLANPLGLPEYKLNAGGDGDTLIRMLTSKDWPGLVNAARDPTFEHTEALRAMFWALPDGDYAAQWRHVLAKAVHESGFTADPVVHFLGTCAELMI